LAVPLVAGVWSLIAFGRLTRRGLAHRRAWLDARRALAAREPTMKDVLLATVQKLDSPAETAIREFEAKWEQIAAESNRRLMARPDLEKLVGTTPWPHARRSA
ncbi:MAG: hypothetical protein R6T96_05425, partial [Longimicrobiales bacterium]